eukprot:jgi/Ulvmu1/6479/UM003_0110.1
MACLPTQTINSLDHILEGLFCIGLFHVSPPPQQCVSMIAVSRIWRSSIATSGSVISARLEIQTTSARRLATRAGLNFKIFSAQDCPLCDGLKDKLEALQQRSQFQEDFWTGMQIEVVDVDTDQELRDKYRMKVPVLAYESNGEWTELPFQSPRLHAEALGKRLEKIITEADG